MSDRLQRMRELTEAKFNGPKTRIAHCAGCAVEKSGAKTRVAIPHTCEKAETQKKTKKK